MILPERVLGRSGVNSRNFGPGDRPDDLGDVLAQLDGQRVRRLGVGPERDEGEDRLAADLVDLADDRGLGHDRVVDQGRLDLDRADPVAGHVHHVVDPAEQPEVALASRLAPSPAKYIPGKRLQYVSL